MVSALPLFLAPFIAPFIAPPGLGTWVNTTGGTCSEPRTALASVLPCRSANRGPAKQRRDHLRVCRHRELAREVTDPQSIEAAVPADSRRTEHCENKIGEDSSVFAFLNKFSAAVCSSTCPFGRFIKDFVSKRLGCSHGRHRNVLPLPVFETGNISWDPQIPPISRSSVTRMLNLTAGGLNWMYFGGRRGAPPSTVTSLHLAVGQRIVSKLLVLVETLGEEQADVEIGGSSERLVCPASDQKYPVLDAEAVAVPTACGEFDPLPCLTKADTEIVTSADRIFQYSANHVPSKVDYNGHPRDDYIALVRRQLRAGKLDLMARP
jgi:hypothetical protein